MLSGDFFIITTIQQNQGSTRADLEINAAHKIFDGHFPGQPVVPGVCMLQIVKEILESVIAKKTRLVSADHLKFLAVIDPIKNKIIQAELKYNIGAEGKIKLTASLINGSVTYFKMSGDFIIEESI